LAVASLMAGATLLTNPPHAYKMSKVALNALTL
jgi:hypothetical protein